VRSEKGHQMKGFALALFLGVTSLFSSGCAVYMAATQPPVVDIAALEEGCGGRNVAGDGR
jgi:hypothetical protein